MSAHFSRKISVCFAVLLLCLCFLPVRLHAQSTTQGAIAGTVVDASGAVVSSATVVLHNDATGAEINLVADASGYFKAPLVPPGTYTVTITAPGFGTFSAKSVPVTVGSLTDLRPELKTGSTQETIEVSGEAPVLHFESPEVSSTLTTQEIVNLPLNGGRWSNLALLTPGAASDSNGFGLISFRGISPIMNNVEIDGADDNQAFFAEERGRTREGYSTSQIAIAEFQVNTGVYSAEYGRAAGGVLNAVTKSGSNSLHGQAYFYDRDNNWGSLNPFTTITQVVLPSGGGVPSFPNSPYQPKDWRKRWGFGAGGKLVENKLFWFYAYDQYKRNFPGLAKPANPATFFNYWADLALPTGECITSTNSTTHVMTAKLTGTGGAPGDLEACTLAWRAYGGDYARAAAHYDQLLFGKAVSSLTGLNAPGLLDDLGPTPRTGDEVLNTPKLDWQVSPNQHISALYHRLRWDSPGGVQTQASNNYAIDTFGTDFVKLDYGLIKLDSMFSTSLQNELRFQYGRELNWEGQQPWSSFTKAYLNNSSGTPVQVCINAAGANSCGSGATGFTAGMPYYSFRSAYPEEKKTQVGDTAIWTRHGHTVKFGLDILRNADTVNNLYQSNGVYTYTYFSNFFSDILNPSGGCDSSGSETGLSTASAYPCYYGFTQGFGTPKFTLTTVDYGFFVQDDWKVTPRLTLNIGLRYDNEQVPAPFQSLISTSLLNVAVNGSGPFPNDAAQIKNQPTDNNNLGPRIGLSWDPYGRGKTVLHAGYGLYYGRNNNGVILNAYEAAGSPNGQFTIPSVYGKTASSTVPVFPNIIGTGTFPTPSLNFFSKNFQNPEVNEFDVSLQQQMPKGTFFSLSYMGAMGRELPNFLNINLNPKTTYQSTLTITENAKYPGSGCGPVACGTQITSNVYSKNYVNTKYGYVTEIVSNINSSYNGMIAEVQNRSWKYAQFDVNYTWSHALDFNQNQSTSPTSNNWYDPLGSPRANYGNSNFNVPNRIVAWGMLQYPGKANGVARFLTDGWHLNPVLQWQNGLPYSAGVSVTQPASGSLKAAGTGMTGTGSSGYLLQLGRNTFKQPNTMVLDCHVQKDLKLSERYNVELLGEAFNVFNHQNVTGVNTVAYTLTSGTSNLVYQPIQGAGVNASGFQSVSNANSNFVYSQRQIQLGIKLDF